MRIALTILALIFTNQDEIECAVPALTPQTINICEVPQIKLDNKKVLIDKIMPILKIVESQCDVDAIGDDGRAFGVLQIHKICVDDVNRIYGTEYTHKQVFDEDIAETIFQLYLGHGIDRYQKKFGHLPSEQQVVRMWNGSIYSGHNKKSTVKYWNKYKTIANA